jgi:hypothetical protein
MSNLLEGDVERGLRLRNLRENARHLEEKLKFLQTDGSPMIISGEASSGISDEEYNLAVLCAMKEIQSVQAEIEAIVENHILRQVTLPEDDREDEKVIENTAVFTAAMA